MNRSKEIRRSARPETVLTLRHARVDRTWRRDEELFRTMEAMKKEFLFLVFGLLNSTGIEAAHWPRWIRLLAGYYFVLKESDATIVSISP